MIAALGRIFFRGMRDGMANDEAMELASTEATRTPTHISLGLLAQASRNAG